MRTAARLAGLFFLIAALLVLGADLAAAGRGADGEFRSLGALWFSLHAASLNLLQAVVERYIWPPLWDQILFPVLQLPAVLVFGVLGILLIGLGFLRRPPPADKAEEVSGDQPADEPRS